MAALLLALVSGCGALEERPGAGAGSAETGAAETGAPDAPAAPDLEEILYNVGSSLFEITDPADRLSLTIDRQANVVVLALYAPVSDGLRALAGEIREFYEPYVEIRDGVPIDDPISAEQVSGSLEERNRPLRSVCGSPLPVHESYEDLRAYPHGLWHYTCERFDRETGSYWGNLDVRVDDERIVEVGDWLQNDALWIAQLSSDEAFLCGVMWPRGYQFRSDPFRIELDGRVVAREGDWFRSGGGAATRVPPNPDCPPVERIFIPGDIELLGPERPPDAYD